MQEVSTLIWLKTNEHPSFAPCKYLAGGFIFLLSFFIFLTGCSLISPSEVDPDINIIQMNMTEIPIGEGTVIASTDLGINLEQSNSPNITTLHLQAIQTQVIATTNLVITYNATVATFNPTGNLSFVLNDLNYVTANGSITINIIYSNVPKNSKVYVQAQILNQNGLKGIDSPESILPLKTRCTYSRDSGLTPTSVQTQAINLTTSTANMVYWNVLNKSNLNGNIIFKIGADFSDSIAQIYTGTLRILLIKSP